MPKNLKESFEKSMSLQTTFAKALIEVTVAESLDMYPFVELFNQNT